MSKITKALGIIALALVINLGTAEAAWHGGGHGWHGGGWHGGGYRGGYYGGGWGWGGFATGAVLGGLLAGPYYYGYGPYYYGGGPYYGGCYRTIRVGTPYGPRLRRVWVCG